MINDNLKMVGKLSIAINDTIVQEIDNLVVTSGKVWVAQRMNNVNTVMTHQAIGTGTATAVVANRRAYVGNVRIKDGGGNVKYLPDAILK